MSDLLNSPVSIKDLEYQFATSGVYAIYCDHTDTYYIGRATVVLRRLVDHFTNLRLGKHINDTLQEEFDRYGEDTFMADLVVDMEGASLVEIKVQEQKEIERFKAHGKRLYNKVAAHVRLDRPKKRTNISRNDNPKYDRPKTRLMSHTERVSEKELKPATCYDCGMLGLLTEDVFECDDGQDRCLSCIEVYLDNWKIDVPDGSIGGSRSRLSGQSYRRWLVPKKAPWKEHVLLAVRNFASKYGYMPTHIYVHPDTPLPVEYKGIEIEKSGIAPRNHIDIPING